MSLGAAPGGLRRDSTIAATFATGEKISVAGPCRLRRIGTEITTATSGTDMVITANSITGATATSLGTFTNPDQVAGLGAYRNFDDFPLIPEGSYLSINVTTAPTAGAGVVWVEYQPLTWASAGLATLAAVTT